MDPHWRWGVPDWRDASAYPAPDDLTANEWWWQFVRRRPDYRELWCTYAKATSDMEAETRQDPKSVVYGMEIADMDTSDFVAIIPGVHEQLGIGRAMNPAIPSPPSHQIAKHTKDGSATEYHEELAIPADPDGYLRMGGQDGLVEVSFDLNKPIPDQVASAQELLKQLQRHRKGGKIERRRRVKHWPTYLRVLDAVDDPMGPHTWAHIAEVVLEGQNIRYEAQAAWERWQAARELMFNWPD